MAGERAGGGRDLAVKGLVCPAKHFELYCK